MLNPVSDDLVNRLINLLPPAAFTDDSAPYLTELRGKMTGHAALVVRPGSTAEVAEVVKLAAAARVPVIPYGGGTGLVGGQLSPEEGAQQLISDLQQQVDNASR